MNNMPLLMNIAFFEGGVFPNPFNSHENVFRAEC